LGGAILIGPSPMFLKHWALAPKKVQLWPQHMGEKCGAFGNIFGNMLKTWRTIRELEWETPWEHDENLMGTLIKTKNPFPSKPRRKKLGPPHAR